MPRSHSSAAQIIGDRIRNARRAQGISMDDLSELSEVSLTSVGKIERGVQSPSAETLVRLATALAIDPGTLVNGLTSEHYGQRDRPYTVRDFMREQRARERAESAQATAEGAATGTDVADESSAAG